MVKITEELVRKKSEHNELLISTLEELSLHQEDIERIEYLHNWCRDLKILLLQSNLIPKIENLYKLKRLEYLNLALNNIERVENLEQLESLNKLDLTLNFIGELTSIESLKDNYNLRQLILTGNPCCDYQHYRDFVVGTLIQLDELDGIAITRTDKLKVKPNVKELRALIVQQQTEYAIKRDEQKLRFVQQKQELDERLANIEDEDERLKAFWNSKSEHCPEIRYEMVKYHNQARQRKDNSILDGDKNSNKSKAPHLFAPCGRPYNMNKPQLPFRLQDEPSEYILELDVYKYLDTSYIEVDIEINYIRVTVKGKVFQIVLNEEVKSSEGVVQRSQITGQLVVKVPKVKPNEILLHNSKKKSKITGSSISKNESLKECVNIKNICNNNNNDDNEQIPDLI